MPRPPKYASEEERIAARRAQRRKSYYAHREEQLEYKRKYKRAHGAVKSAVGYEVLTVEDMEQLSKAPTDMSERVLNAMNIDFTAEYREQFIQMLRDNEQTDELLNKAFDLVRKSSATNNSRKGYLFESVMRKNILYELRMKQQKLYAQIPINKNSCRIDFALSNEVLEDKTKLDLSQAVIISTKTSLKTKWREDQHLYTRCKAYVMVTLDDKFPSAALPDNVYFCSPHVTEETDHIINLNNLLPTIMEYLDAEDTNEDTDEETNEEQDEETDATEQ